MTLLSLPWLELALAIALAGALGVSRLRNPNRAFRWGLILTGAVFFCTFVAWLGSYLGTKPDPSWSLQYLLFGRQFLEIDELSAPLIPVVALLHFLTVAATARTKMRRFSVSWSLAVELLGLATFACKDYLLLIALLAAGAIPPYVELKIQEKPTRVYLLHAAVFLALLLAGAVVQTWTTTFLAAALLIRCGIVPAHCWFTDWLEHASFGIALLHVLPLAGVYAVIRLVLPFASEAMLHGIGLAALVTAVYAAGMAVVQREVRRFFAYLFLSHSALVLVGLELPGTTALTGSLALWFSLMLSLGGFGLVLRALELRFGRLSLNVQHGLYDHSPTLAVCFLLTGLAGIGFPGTLGFVSSDLLVDGALLANPAIGIAVIAAAALNGIAIVRAYLLLFTGARHTSTVSLEIGSRERIAVLTLAVLILGGGLFPQPGISSRRRAAEEILAQRDGLPRGSTEEAGEQPR
ncbi:MAG: proton-conducting transporter transmembrane domain-containing protein [Gemmataceae bacterium]